MNLFGRVLPTVFGAPLIVVFSIAFGHAGPNISGQELARIEKEFNAELARQQKTHPDPQRRYRLLLLAARELRAHGFEAKSREYYKKALSVETSESKEEPAIELFHDSLRRALASGSGREQVYSDLKTALKFAADEETRTYLNSVTRGLLEPQAAGPDANPLVGGFYGHAIQLRHLEYLVEKKRYAEALAILDRKGASEASINEKITFDVIQVLVNRNKSGPLLCEAMLRKYPDTATHTLEACAYLLEFIRTEKRDDGRMARIRNLALQEKSSNPMLIRALEDLR